MAQQANAGARPQVDEGALAMLTSMGFDLETSRVALEFTNNDIEQACDTVMNGTATMLLGAANARVDFQALGMLYSMGFMDMQKNIIALKRSPDVEGATELLFSGILETVIAENPEESNLQNESKNFFYRFIQYFIERLHAFPIPVDVEAVVS